MKRTCLAIVLLLSFLNIINAQPAAPDDKIIYVCPPCNGNCDQLQFDKPGVCPHCKMDLAKMKLGDFKKQLALKPVTICFYLQDGVEVLDFAGPMEVFIAAGFNVFTVSKTHKPLRAQTVLFVTPDYTIQDAPAADILAVLVARQGTELLTIR
jgi:hypothetical protein